MLVFVDKVHLICLYNIYILLLPTGEKSGHRNKRGEDFAETESNEDVVEFCSSHNPEMTFLRSYMFPKIYIPPELHDIISKSCTYFESCTIH